MCSNRSNHHHPDLDGAHLSDARADLTERIERQAAAEDVCCPGTACVCRVDGPKSSCVFYRTGLLDRAEAASAASEPLDNGLDETPAEAEAELSAFEARCSSRVRTQLDQARDAWDRQYGYVHRDGV